MQWWQWWPQEYQKSSRLNQQNGNLACTSYLWHMSLPSLHFYVTGQIWSQVKLFYLCWFFNFLCLLGLEDKQTCESTCNLGQKVLRIFHFLNHRMPILRICYRCGTPPLTPPWSKFFSRDQKRSSRASTLFLWGQGGVSVVASAFKSLMLKLDTVMSQRFCLRLYM